ncbi:hypothetical protein PS2_003035 [Malus domestica]
MAGTVGGSIGLDSEYYCRRCDEKTDLVSYKTSARDLLKRIEVAIEKLKCGTNLEDIGLWSIMKDNIGSFSHITFLFLH